MAAKKDKYTGMSENLAELVMKACNNLITKGTQAELDAYAEAIKLLYSHCLYCESNTPLVECEAWAKCGICQQNKRRLLIEE